MDREEGRPTAEPVGGLVRIPEDEPAARGGGDKRRRLCQG